MSQVLKGILLFIFFHQLYVLKIPLIERLKTYPGPWPWEVFLHRK